MEDSVVQRGTMEIHGGCSGPEGHHGDPWRMQWSRGAPWRSMEDAVVQRGTMHNAECGAVGGC